MFFQKCSLFASRSFVTTPAPTSVLEQPRTIDFQFRLLYAIAIALVVAGHVANGGVNILFDWFTPYAFHLGIFAFGSGYFYKTQYANTQLKYLKRKIIHLIVPLYLCNIFYAFIVYILKKNGVMIGGGVTLENLIISPLFHLQFLYNLGTWFVFPLFFVEIFNNLFYRFSSFLRGKQICIIFCVYLGLGVLSVSLSRHGYNTGWYLPLMRSMFLLPMFGLGMIYRKYRIFDSVNTWIFLLVVMILQYGLILCFKGPVANDICWMTGFRGGVLVPFFSAFLGIFFWLRVCAVLAPIASKSRIISLSKFATGNP